MPHAVPCHATAVPSHAPCRAVPCHCCALPPCTCRALPRRCFCDRDCSPSPPPPYNCDELAPNGARCGAAANGTQCKYCCGATGYCGDGDLWCSAGADEAFSYKLRDPERVACPRQPTHVEFEQYCTVNPATNKQLCVRLPAGRDFDDPMVMRRLEEVFAKVTPPHRSG